MPGKSRSAKRERKESRLIEGVGDHDIYTCQAKEKKDRNLETGGETPRIEDVQHQDKCAIADRQLTSSTRIDEGGETDWGTAPGDAVPLFSLGKQR